MIVEENSRILVFCKAPIPGACKTRLAKSYGARGAAKISRQLFFNTTSKLLDQSDFEVELCCSPVTSHPDFLSIRREHFSILRNLNGNNLNFSLQQSEDLGRRMYHAASRVLNTRSYVVIIGTDCPAMKMSYIKQAFSKLYEGNDIVIGPATDGGYVLLGLRIAEIRLFQNIDWGSNKVLQQTLRNCRQLKIEPQLLTPLDDIDYAADWIKWKRDE